MAVGIGIALALIGVLLIVFLFRASGFINRTRDRERRIEQNLPKAERPVVETRRTGLD